MINVSLVLYKTEYVDIRALLEVLLAEEKVNELYLIDNSPTDVISKLLPSNDKLVYISTGKNLGYGAGHNIAIRKSLNKTPYHLVVNPDINIAPGVLTSLWEFMELNKEVGHVMPKILNTDGSVQYVCKLVPTPGDLFLKRFLGVFFRKNLSYRFQLKFTGYDRQMDVPYLSGCFMFLRCAALKEVGIFDERFFMYPEDIDLTRRIHEKYRTVFYPAVSAIHGHGAASYKSYRMLYIHISNMILYFNKWGWIKDKRRAEINRKILKALQYNG